MAYSVVLVHRADPLFTEVCQMLYKDHEVLQFETMQDAFRLLDANKHYVIFCQLNNVDSLKELIPLLKTQRAKILSGKVRLMVLNRLTHLSVPRILGKMGFSDVISSPVVKASGLVPRIENQLASGGRLYFTEVDTSGVSISDPLEIPSNSWLLRDPKDARRVRDQWIVDLIGPGPSAGRWVKKEGQPDISPLLTSMNEELFWEWIPRMPGQNPFTEPNSTWSFYGKRPYFSDFHWIFVSSKPQLTYLKNGESIADYFKLDPSGVLRIADNSKIALKKWNAIQASILSDYRIPISKIDTRPKIWTFSKEVSRNPIKIKGDLTPAVTSNLIANDASSKVWHNLIGFEEAEAPLPGSSEKDVQPTNKITSVVTAPEVKNTPEVDSMLKIQLNNSLFRPVENSDHRYRYLMELAQANCRAVLWTRGQKLRVSVLADYFDLANQSLRLQKTIESDYRELCKQIQGGSEEPLFVNFGLFTGALFFVLPICRLTLVEDQVSIPISSDLYEVQRRIYPRYQIPNDQKIYLYVGSRNYRILNLSAGGVAIQIKTVDEKYFEKGIRFDTVLFQIQEYEFRCGAQVRWIRKNPDHTLQAGIQFIGLSAESEEKINLYVYEHGFQFG